MTPLRQRFIDDLRLRNYARRTIDTYVGRIVCFARHFGRSPEVLGASEVREFQLHLLGQRVSWSSFNQAVCALRFLYGTTLGRPEQLPLIPFGKRPKTLPSVLSPAEVLRLLEAAEPGRDRVLLQVAYGCGLRLSELLHLQVSDIDSARMVIHVRQGKGAKDRLVPLVAAVARSAARVLAEVPPTRLAVSRAQAGSTPQRRQRPAHFQAPGQAGRAEQALLACTRCGTATPRICSKPASMC